MAIAVKNNYIYSAEWNSVQIFEYGEIDGPDLDLSTYELNYPYVENGQFYTMSLNVENNGNQVLNIIDAYTTNNEFSYSVLNNLSPGESQTVDIIYNANSNNSSGSYRIFSNDNDESEVICETNGNIDGANIGDIAPDFDLDIIANDSGSFQLSDYIGKVVVLVFFAPNWPVCSPELSDIETAVWQNFDNSEVAVIGISNTNNQNVINNFVAENSLTFPILFDPGSSGGVQGGDTYDLYYMPNDGSPYPRDFVIDQDGIIAYANNEIDTAWMLAVINDLLMINDMVLGDINQDFIVNILDIVLLISFILSSEIPSDNQFLSSDINADGIINILDVVSIINIILNI